MRRTNGVEYLKQTLREKQSDRDRREELEKDAKDRRRMIEEAAPIKDEDFWCSQCDEDFVSRAHKHVNWIYNVDTRQCEEPKVWRAWYEGSCPEGHRAIRRITDKQNDPYYQQSRWVKHQQRANADDFLTPDDPRFRIKYPQQWARLQAQYGTQ